MSPKKSGGRVLDRPPYFRVDPEVVQISRQLIDFNKRLEHLERLEDPAGGYTEGARAYSSANIAIPNNVITTINYDSELYDTDTIHSTLVNTSRLTCRTAGKYVITAHCAFVANATGFRYLDIYLNGATRISAFAILPSVIVDTYLLATTIYPLIVGDYVETRVRQTSGGALNLYGLSRFTADFMMQRVG